MLTSRPRTRAGRRPRWSPVLALLLAAGSVTAVESPAATASLTLSEKVRTVAGTTTDFDGDGNADLAIASGDAVQVVYGTGNGLGAARTQRWTGDDIPAVPTASIAFGATLATGDFDGDGFCDLAIGDDGATVDGGEDAGAVAVIYGSADGLTAAGSQYLTRNTVGGPGTATLDDRFGRSMAAADFGRGRYDDLAIGSFNQTDGGSVHLLYGSAHGLSATGSQVWSQATPGVRGAPEVGDAFGRSLAAADFNGRGQADLAVGVPEERVGKVRTAGAVQVLFGSTDGLTATGNQAWHRDSPGIKGRAAPAALFGNSLGAGHFRGGAAADLVVGALGDRSFSVLYGSSTGLTATDQLWNSASDGLPRGTFGGTSLLPGSYAAANFGHDPAAGARDDLAVGVDGRTDGGVLVLYGGRSGLSASGSEVWSQSTAGVPGSARRGDQFGAALTAGRFDGGSRYPSLAVGTPGKTREQASAAGMVHVLRSGSGGLQGSGGQFWTDDELGQPTTAGASFGDALGSTGP